MGIVVCAAHSDDPPALQLSTRFMGSSRRVLGDACLQYAQHGASCLSSLQGPPLSALLRPHFRSRFALVPKDSKELSMPITFFQPASAHQSNKPSHQHSVLPTALKYDIASGLLLCLLTVLLVALVGCGAGGYAGGGIEGTSVSSFVIDAGQSYKVTTAVEGAAIPNYALSCSTSACGSLSSTSGASVVYTAPAGITSQLKVTLTAAVPGTHSSATVAITVNPDPTLPGVPAGGTIGTAYTAALNPTGGTTPLTLSLTSGTLPPGLSFNATTGTITGTPTTAGTYTFAVQLTDASVVPFTLSTPETIVIAAPAVTTLTLSGNPPAGTVNTAYATTFAATGGTAPYTFSLLSGALPAGLTLSPTGVVTGTPTTAAVAVFTLQATDGNGDKGTAVFSITINPAPLSLTLGTMPNGTVNVPYSSTIGVAGGTSPYSCSITAGTLPAGLTLSANCLVSGTPTVAGTANLTVKATDSSNPQESTTGPVSLTINPAALSITVGTLPSGTVNVPYSSTIGVAGGTSPYACTITAGTLPAGLTLGANCLVSGTPTVAGTANLTVKATDSSNPQESTTGPVSLTINPAGSLVIMSPPSGTVGVPYTGPIGVSGGTGPYTCTITAGALPAGLMLNGCTITGTPTAPGTTTVTVKGTDSSNPPKTGTGPVTITINPSALSLTVTSLPNGMVNVPYSSTIGVTGGTAPYSCTITAGTLPAGLTLGANCLVSGTPTIAGTSNLTVKATDSSNPQESTTGPVSLTINPAASLTITSPPAGTVGTPYTGPIGVSGGTGPYTCTITSGALPAGLTLNGCTITGTPTAPGTTTVTVKGTDSSNPPKTGTGPVTITINPSALSLTVTSLPNGMVNVPYSSTIGVTGGTAPYSCTITAGTLPAGLTLGANCLVSGTPTVAGTANLTVKATDSSNPQESTTGPVSLTINPAALTLTVTSLPNGMVNVPYSSTIGVTGGTAPYSCTITAGTLPAGLTLGANCLVSGTPTVAGTANLTVKATDSSNPQESTTGPVSLTITPAELKLTVSSLPNGTVGTPYSSTIGVSGGTSPYSCIITAGTLPAGLTLGANCLVSGTPTVAGTANLTVKATDSSNPQESTTGPVSLTINPAAVTLTLTSPPAGTINVPYMGSVGVAGGTAPYTCTLTAGTLPTGLTLGANCAISGTPTTSGSSTFTVKATDSSTPANTTTGPVTLVINPATTTLTLTPPPAATVDTPYNGVIGVSGGTAPYTCTITAGNLPAGLTLGANCTITGTPTTAGSATVTVHATDSSNPTATTTGPVTITVNPLSPLTLTGSLPNATLGVPYTQTLTAQGGLAPYTYAITAGALPAGLSLDSSTGVISGTPTVIGASSFTVTATDSEPTPAQASLPLIINVLYPTTPSDVELTGPYAYLFQGYDDVVAGVLAYQTATVGSFTADGKGGITLGELDANHQASDPAGNTIASANFLGTYTLGTDNRGSLTLTVLNADGTTGATTTYAIAVQAPIAPSTITVQGSLIESDDNQLVGTKGSGTLLAQTSTAFASGLNGSYAFGVSGDTPCLPACTIGILAGPAATVGQFTTDGAGAITAGTSDTNIATTNTANAALGGTYTTADGNGRIQLSLSTQGAPTPYPTDFAVYVVNANQAFILSTDKHSAYILLAGSATLQSQTTFSDASMNSAFIGYENSSSDPGLLGATLQNVLNLSTATIFRGTGSSNGNCAITNVDTGGVTSLVSGLTGILGGGTGLTGILGAYTQTGNTTCAVTSNGRGVLQYPVATLLGLPVGTPPAPRVFYLTAPNAGYFLETSYAGLGKFEAQTGGPFSEATTFTGTYVYGSAPASSLASIDTSGVIASNGKGSATSTLDLNVGVGTLNVIELGQTSTQPYSTPNATSGRFTLGADGYIVLYAITPNRFVLLDTNPLTTSPSVAVLY
jgi:hypothetical protein